MTESKTREALPQGSRTPRPVTLAPQEQVWRARIKEMLGFDPDKSYGDLDLSYTFRDALFVYSLLLVVVGASCALFVANGPIVLLLSPAFALLSGIGFNWINVQIHEASHGLLLRDRKWNDIYCNVVLGSWALQDVEIYRATHGMHHANLHTEKDPDLGIYTQHVGSSKAMLKGIAEDLLLFSAFRRNKQARLFLAKHAVVLTGRPRYSFVAKLTAQSIVVAIYIYWCGLWGIALYGACYLFGLLAVFPVLVRIRTVVQHYGDELKSEDRPLPFISRTTVAPILESVLVGARMDYHFEHHVYPTLPYYSLRKMHKKLKAAGLFEEDGGCPGLTTENYLKTYAYLAT